MLFRTAFTLLISVALGALVGCGSSSPVFDPIVEEPETVYRIAVLAPIEEGQVEFGRGIRNGVLLAAAEHNRNRTPSQPVFEVVTYDDRSDPQTGLSQAERILDLPGLVGVVGTYNSGVARAVLPLFHARGIPMLSPGNTDPTLTLGSDPSSPVRPYGNYFRMVVPDTLQGPALALHARSQGYGTAVILSESREVSLGLARAFEARFTAEGGRVLGFVTAPAGTTDYRSLLEQFDLEEAEMLFYGGEVPNASLVKNAALASGFEGPLYGGDGVKNNSYIQAVGSGADGDVATSLGAPAELLPSAAAFLESYSEAGFSDPPTDFGPFAYDAARLLMTTAELEGGRYEAMIERLAAVDREGITGRLAFDAFGDTLNRILTLNEVVMGAFLPSTVIDLSEQ